eukprot:gene1637-1006_t
MCGAHLLPVFYFAAIWPFSLFRFFSLSILCVLLLSLDAADACKFKLFVYRKVVGFCLVLVKSGNYIFIIGIALRSPFKYINFTFLHYYFLGIDSIGSNARLSDRPRRHSNTIQCRRVKIQKSSSLQNSEGNQKKKEDLRYESSVVRGESSLGSCRRTSIPPSFIICSAHSLSPLILFLLCFSVSVAHTTFVFFFFCFDNNNNKRRSSRESFCNVPLVVSNRRTIRKDFFSISTNSARSMMEYSATSTIITPNARRFENKNPSLPGDSVRSFDFISTANNSTTNLEPLSSNRNVNLSSPSPVLPVPNPPSRMTTPMTTPQLAEMERTDNHPYSPLSLLPAPPAFAGGSPSIGGRERGHSGHQRHNGEDTSGTPKPPTREMLTPILREGSQKNTPSRGLDHIRTGSHQNHRLSPDNVNEDSGNASLSSTPGVPNIPATKRHIVAPVIAATKKSAVSGGGNLGQLHSLQQQEHKQGTAPTQSHKGKRKKWNRSVALVCVCFVASFCLCIHLQEIRPDMFRKCLMLFILYIYDSCFFFLFVCLPSSPVMPLTRIPYAPLAHLSHAHNALSSFGKSAPEGDGVSQRALLYCFLRIVIYKFLKTKNLLLVFYVAAFSLNSSHAVGGICLLTPLHRALHGVRTIKHKCKGKRTHALTSHVLPYGAAVEWRGSNYN